MKSPSLLFPLLCCLLLAAAAPLCAQTVRITPIRPENADEVKLPELRAELSNRLAADQKKRMELNQKYSGAPLPPQAMEEMQKIDRENTAWIKQKLAEYGWLGTNLVGLDGSQAAFILVQHASHDLDFQKQALELLRKAIKAGEALPVHLAYLTDRVRLLEGRPQVYGTQTRVTKDGRFEMPPIEDEPNVDKRRSEVGLEPLADYIQRMRQKYERSPTK